MALAVLASAVCASACAAVPAAAPPGTASPAPRYPLGLTTYAPGERGSAPLLAGTGWKGKEVDAEALRGHVVVLNAWASWCEPCRQEARVLTALAVRSPQTRFVGLDESGSAEASAAFLRSSGARYRQVPDDGALLRTLATWLPAALPGTLVLDRQGRVAARVVGAVPTGLLDPVLARLARE